MENTNAIEKFIHDHPTIDALTDTNTMTKDWLFSNGALRDSRECKECGLQMMLWTDYNRADGFVWGCRNCNVRHTIRSNEIYKKHSKVPLIMLTKIIFCFFAPGINAKCTASYLNSKYRPVFQISYPTIRNTYDEIRAKISKYVTILAGNEKLGGIEKIVEVDESVFSHIKLKSEKKFGLWGFLSVKLKI